jgi:hypothetical protein
MYKYQGNKKELFVNKTLKIVLIAAAIVVVTAGLFFVLTPLVTSKATEEKLAQVLLDAGIPEEMWNAEKAYYIPILNNLVVENLTIGEDDDESIRVEKITLTIKTNRDTVFAGSINVKGVSFSADDISLAAGNFSAVDFLVDTEQLKNMQINDIKKIGKVSVSNAYLKGGFNLSLGQLNADINYIEGKIPASSALSLKDFIIDVRPFGTFRSFRSLRPEYQITSMDLKNSLSKGVDTVTLAIECRELFNIKTNLGISYPYTSFTPDIAGDIKLHAFSFTYTDKSFLNHIFELAGMPGGGENVKELLDSSIVPFASMGGIDAERFAKEAANFFAKPNTLNLKTDIKTPINAADIMDDPFALNISLTINGGKPFTTSNQ